MHPAAKPERVPPDDRAPTRMAPQPPTPATSEAALLFWVGEAVKSAAAPPLREAERPQTAPLAEPPAALSRDAAARGPRGGGKRSRSHSESSSLDALAGEGRGGGGETSAQRWTPPPRPAPPATTTVRDVMPFLDHVLEGQLGPVAVDIQILGHTSLLADPEAFRRALQSHEQGSTGPLQTLLGSVKPFFFTGGGGFYTMDAAVYPSLPTLALLLAAPNVRKIVANASLLYRLLFLFLGTDRVDIANLVDVGSWNAVLRQSGTTSRALRSQLLPAAPSDGCIVAKQLFDALPLETRVMLSSQASRVVAHDGAVSSTAALRPAAIAAEDGHTASGPGPDNGEEDGGGGLTPPLRAAIMASARVLPEIPTIAQVEEAEANADVEQILSEAGKGRPQQPQHPSRRNRSAGNAGNEASRALARTFTDLGSAFYYYDCLMKPLENSGVGGPMAGGAPANSDATTSGPVLTAADVCARHAYAAFMCAVMSYHGVFVSRDRYERFCSHLTEQVAELTEAAVGVVDDIAAQMRGRGEDRLAFTPDTTAAALRAYVVNLLLRHSHLKALAVSSSSSPSPSSSPAAQRDAVRALYKALRTAPAAGLEDGEVRVARSAKRLLALWLAIQERLEYRNGALGKLFSNLGPHLRVSVTNAAAAHGSGASVPAAAAAYSVHPLWSVHGHSTGRIFASSPNLQTIAKDPPLAVFDCAQLTSGAEVDGDTEPGRFLFCDHPEWTLRHLCIAPTGCSFVSLDFNQVELRVLAHLSRDPHLIASLSDEGADVLAEVARLVFRHQSVADVTAPQRQAMKVVVYGLIYGMGPELLDERLRKTGQGNEGPPVERQDPPKPPLSARELTAALYHAFPYIQGYLRGNRLRALHDMQTETLCGVKDLSDEPDANRRKQRAVAWAVQGGAADILHAAVRAVHERRHQLLPYFPAAPLALLMTVHDELVYAVPLAAVDAVVPQLKEIVEGQGRALGLRVPLRVSVKVGPSLGELRPY